MQRQAFAFVLFYTQQKPAALQPDYKLEEKSMNQETTKLGRTIMAVMAVLVGLFLMFISPYIVMDALNPALHRLVDVFQVQDPDGVWDTPVAILTATFHIWLALFVFAGA